MPLKACSQDRHVEATKPETDLQGRRLSTSVVDLNSFDDVGLDGPDAILALVTILECRPERTVQVRLKCTLRPFSCTGGFLKTEAVESFSPTWAKAAITS